MCLTNKPLVSIIVPVYNQEKYLKRCLKSIAEQTYNNIEIIIINDGSTDKSLEISQDFAANDERIVIFSKTNESTGYARNAGLDIASGHYIMFVDSDDYIAPYCIENSISIATEEHCDIVKVKAIKGKSDDYRFKSEECTYKIIDNHRALMSRETKVSICGKLIRKNLFNKLRCPKETVNEDEFITYKILYVAKKIAIMNDICYYYFTRKDSVQRSKHELPCAFIRAFDERIKFFRDKGEGELEKASHKELAIRLMVLYLTYDQYDYATYTKEELLISFYKHYNLGRGTAGGIKEKVSLNLFKTAPNGMKLLYGGYINLLNR